MSLYNLFFFENFRLPFIGKNTTQGIRHHMCLIEAKTAIGSASANSILIVGLTWLAAKLMDIPERL